MLIRRVATAAVALPALLAAVYFGGYAFAALAAAAAGGGAWELCRMSKARGVAPFVPLAVALAAGCAIAGLWANDLPPEGYRAAMAASLAAMAVSALFLVRARVGGGWLGRTAATLSAALLVGGAMFHATTLRESPEGVFLILFALAATFASDTGAYFVGRAFGSRKLAPAISPNKTWEGAVGGLISATAAGALAGAAAHLASPYNLPDLTLFLPISGAVGGALGIIGQFGDLYVSKLKRKAGFDDSGGIFPGHGGILDRMDSLMFSATAMAYLNPITLSRLF